MREDCEKTIIKPAWCPGFSKECVGQRTNAVRSEALSRALNSKDTLVLPGGHVSRNAVRVLVLPLSLVIIHSLTKWATSELARETHEIAHYRFENDFPLLWAG